MKVCKRCFTEFDGNEKVDYSPAIDLADTFLSDMVNIDDLCPDCREEIGMLNLIGFEP